MIVRIVKMTFDLAEVENFKLLFEKYKNGIRNAEGCCYLELIQEKSNPAVFMTYSHWEEEKYLEIYKSSELFGVVWPLTKSKFAKPAEAWTLNRLHQLK